MTYSVGDKIIFNLEHWRLKRNMEVTAEHRMHGLHPATIIGIEDIFVSDMFICTEIRATNVYGDEFSMSFDEIFTPPNIQELASL